MFMDTNTKLSVKRTKLASMRTLLSYVRTALLSISVAVAFIKLDKAHPFDWYTIVFIALSAVFLVVGVVQHIVTINAIEKQ